MTPQPAVPEPQPRAAPPMPRAGRRADAIVNDERIIAATLALSAAGGLPTMEEIAAAAGVGVATLYRRYPRRDVLQQAVIARQLTEALEPIVTRALAATSPLAGLFSIASSMVTLAAARTESDLTQSASLGTLADAVLDRFADRLDLLLVAAQSRGEIRTDLVRADIPNFVVMMLGGIALSEHRIVAAERYVAIVFDALRPNPENPPLPPLG